jgi:hypothetical protein
VKGCNSFIFRIARGVTEIDPRKSALRKSTPRLLRINGQICIDRLLSHEYFTDRPDD